MAVPPKSMRQGIYWVQTALKVQRQQQRDSLRAERDSEFNKLREQAISFERDWVQPIGDLDLSPKDAKAVVSEVKALRKTVNSCAEKATLTHRDLERTTFRLLNAIFNVAFVAIKYGVKKSRTPRIRWTPAECVVYIGEVPYMELKHGTKINPLDCVVPTLPRPTAET